MRRNGRRQQTERNRVYFCFGMETDMTNIRKTAALLLLMTAVSFSACGCSTAPSGTAASGTAASAETAASADTQSETETAAARETEKPADTDTKAAEQEQGTLKKGVYTNKTLGIRITPGDGFTAYNKADTFSKAVRGSKWADAFGENNRFEFGYAVESGGAKGYFYGYSIPLSEKEQAYDLDDFVSAAALQVSDGEVQENGTKEIGSMTYRELDITGDDGTQEIVYLTKAGNTVMAIVIGQMQDSPIEDACFDAVESL